MKINISSRPFTSHFSMTSHFVIYNLAVFLSPEPLYAFTTSCKQKSFFYTKLIYYLQKFEMTFSDTTFIWMSSKEAYEVSQNHTYAYL